MKFWRNLPIFISKPICIPKHWLADLLKISEICAHSFHEIKITPPTGMEWPARLEPGVRTAWNPHHLLGELYDTNSTWVFTDGFVIQREHEDLTVSISPKIIHFRGFGVWPWNSFCDNYDESHDAKYLYFQTLHVRHGIFDRCESINVVFWATIWRVVTDVLLS